MSERHDPVGEEATTALPLHSELQAVNERLLISGLREQELADQLSHQLAFLSAITANLVEGVYAEDRSGRISFVNPAAERLLGWTEAELLGQDAHELLHVGCADRRYQPPRPCPLQEVANTGAVYRNADDIFARRDGTVLPVAYSSAPIVAAGEVTGAVVTFNDVTERKRASAQRDALHATTAALSHALTPAQVADVALQRGLEVFGADAGLLALLREDGATLDIVARRGHAPGALDGFNPIALDAPLALPAAVRTAAPVFLESEPSWLDHFPESVALIASIEQAAGAALPLVVDGRPLGALCVTFTTPRSFSEDERSMAMTLAGQCAQALERARLYALEQQTRMRVEHLAAEREAILGQMGEGIIIADPNGHITFINEAARRMHGVAALGVTVDDYAATYHLATLEGAPYPSHDLPLARAVEHGETVIDARWRIQRAEGADVIAEGSATPVIDNDGVRLGAVLLVRDVTAQYGLERQKEEFLSSVAHDLQSPLTAIKGNAQFLLRHVRRAASLDAARLQAGLEQIEFTSTQMTTLVRELLDLAHLRMGQVIELRRQPTDLAALSRRAVAAQEGQGVERRIRVDCDATEIIGTWDADRLERMLANLLSNAIKYSSEGGEIRLMLTREESGDGSTTDRVPSGAWAILRVQDDGVGVPADDLPHIFELYRRGRNVVGRISGTGIGLSSARLVVEQHGGTIAVDSTEGSGTTVTVRLPL